ncbi:MAG: helix-turn-helix domain-containing protein [Dehalococcoidia bacterium]
MAELGKTFSQARVARGLTLEDCERDTRISKRYLDALEREDWKIFPAPVYSRAFLRTYAQYLGLNPGELMRQFLAQEEEQQPIKPLPEIRPPAASGSINWTLAGAVLLVLLVAGFFVYNASRGGDGGAASVTIEPINGNEAEGGGPPPAGRAVGDIEQGIVPDLTSVSISDAIAALDTAEIAFVIVETGSVEGQPGVVLSQDPAAGTEATGDTSVTLVVPLQ